MKATYGWHNGGNGTNSSGFSGLPGGNRDLNSYFDDAGYYESWWSSSPEPPERRRVAPRNAAPSEPFSPLPTSVLPPEGGRGAPGAPA